MTFEEFKHEWELQSPYIQAYTSGSTGTPKSIILEKEDMVRSARRTLRFFFPDYENSNWKGIHLHSCLNCDYIGGKMMAVRGLISDAEITFEVPSNDPLSGSGLNSRIDLVSVVNSQLEALLTKKENGTPLPEIGHILVGGSSLPPGIGSRVSASGFDVWESYGMTETSSHIALRRVATGSEKEWFRTLPPVTVSANEDDCLVIKLENKTFVTNDIAEVNSPTEFRITGRKDNVIISGGLKINPEKVEQQVASKIKELCGLSSAQFAITSRVDEKWGERVVLAVEEPLIEENWKTLISELKKELPAHEVPKEWIKRKIPLTPNGKIDRRRLRW